VVCGECEARGFLSGMMSGTPWGMALGMALGKDASGPPGWLVVLGHGVGDPLGDLSGSCVG
jgi:hypothetical protein